MHVENEKKKSIKKGVYDVSVVDKIVAVILHL